LILVIIAALLYLLTDLNTGAVVAIGALGLVSIAISRKKK